MITRALRKVATVIAFISLPLFFYTLFVWYSMAFTFLTSFQQWSILNPTEITFVGLNNYVRLLTDWVFKTSFLNNVLWAAWNTCVPLVVGLILAELLRKSFKGRRFFVTVFYAPSVISGVVVGIIWCWILHPEFGAVNRFLSAIGIPQNILPSWFSSSLALVSALTASTWSYTGFCMILYLTAMQSISPELYEAAEIDGATGFQRFIYVTIPMLKNTTLVNLCIVLISAFKVFDIVFTMTKGGPGFASSVMALYLFLNAFQFDNPGKACAIGILLTAIVLPVTIVYLERGGFTK